MTCDLSGQPGREVEHLTWRAQVPAVPQAGPLLLARVAASGTVVPVGGHLGDLGNIVGAHPAIHSDAGQDLPQRQVGRGEVVPVGKGGQRVARFPHVSLLNQLDRFLGGFHDQPVHLGRRGFVRATGGFSLLH